MRRDDLRANQPLPFYRHPPAAARALQAATPPLCVNGPAVHRSIMDLLKSVQGQKPKLPRCNINGRFTSINGHNVAKLPVLPTAEALSRHAATTLASKGRLMRCTVQAPPAMSAAPQQADPPGWIQGALSCQSRHRLPFIRSPGNAALQRIGHSTCQRMRTMVNLHLRQSRCLARPA